MPRNVVTLSSRLLVLPTRKNRKARRAIIAALGDRYPALSSDGGKRLAIHFPKDVGGRAAKDEVTAALDRIDVRWRRFFVLHPNEKSLASEVRVGSTLYKEALMFARVVSFDGVSSDRMAEMQKEMEGNSERPENVPAKEIVVLHDPESDRSLVILFFESEEDYRRGDEALNAMPTTDTPGQRTSVTKYQVAFRMAD